MLRLCFLTLLDEDISIRWALSLQYSAICDFFPAWNTDSEHRVALQGFFLGPMHWNHNCVHLFHSFSVLFPLITNVGQKPKTADGVSSCDLEKSRWVAFLRHRKALSTSATNVLRKHFFSDLERRKARNNRQKATPFDKNYIEEWRRDREQKV